MKRAWVVPALFLAACASAQFDPEGLEKARLHADSVKSGAVMVLHRGGTVAAWGDVARKLELHSVRKSLYAAMYGIAVQKKLIDVNATLADLGVDDLGKLTDDEKKARVEDLLFARSGVYHPAAYAPADQDADRPKRGSHAPGTHWFYNNWDFNVAGALLERAAGKPLGVLFDEWIARPIGMQDYQPGDVYAFLEPRTSQWPALTFRMSTRDLARFGQLWLSGGKWKGKQIVPAAWIAKASAPRTRLPAAGEGYAMMWWTYAKGSLPAERYPNASRYAMLNARGTGGQSVVLIPELELVFVHRGDTDHGRHVRGRDVWIMLEQILTAFGKPGKPTAPMALASQLPPLEWPKTITLDAAAREALTGRYRFTPDIVATVYVHDNRLFVHMPGKGEAELFAKSPGEFWLRVDPTAEVRFEGGKVFVKIEGREMVGTKL